MDSFPSPQEEEDEILTLALSPELSVHPSLAPTAAPASAFTGYVATASSECLSSSFAGGGSMHRRVPGFLRRIPVVRSQVDTRAEVGSSRSFQHLMRERLRRERQSQGYADLHALLPTGTKASKLTIVEGAAACVEELKGRREELKRRNEDLSYVKVDRDESSIHLAEIKLRVPSSLSVIDLMIEALASLKGINVKARTVKFEFSGEELSVLLGVQREIEAAEEVEKAIRSTLMELEKKFHAQL